MKLSDHITLSPDVVARELGDETVLLDLRSGIYFGLDLVGCRIWALLESGTSLDEVCSTLLSEFDVSREVLERDVLALLQELAERKLIQAA